MAPSQQLLKVARKSSVLRYRLFTGLDENGRAGCIAYRPEQMWSPELRWTPWSRLRQCSAGAFPVPGLLRT